MVKLSKFTKELLIAAISATISATITGYFTFMAGKAQAADVSNITVHIDGQEQIVNADEIATFADCQPKRTLVPYSADSPRHN